MEFTILKGPNVGIFDSFLDSTDCKDLYDFAVWSKKHNFQLNSVDEDDLSMEQEPGEDRKEEHANEWKARNFSLDLYPDIYRRLSRRVYKKSLEAVNQYLSKIYSDSNFNVEHYEFSTLHYLPQGDKIDEHVDCYDYGLVFYAGFSNDYSGGDLYFREHDTTLKPVANRMLMIPSDVLHEVFPIESGHRVSMTTFVPVTLS